MFERILIYIKERFPLAHILSGLFWTITYFLAIEMANEGSEFKFNDTIFRASLTVVLVLLLLRIMDEIKDYEDDLIHAPENPLPRGIVKFGDLKILSIPIILAIFLLNMGNTATSIGAISLFTYCTLMFKWFFIKDRIRASLPLALITHNPIILVIYFYLFMAATRSNPQVDLFSALVAIPLALNLTNWEISRKITSKEDKNTGATYSGIWGFKNSIFVALAIQVIIVGGVTAFLTHITASPILITIYIAISLIISYQYVLYMTKKVTLLKISKKRPMRPYAELFSFIANASIIVAYIVQ